MDEKEVRIGNYVNIEDTILRIELQELYYNASIMTPIPLTEEWLLKLGFDLINNEYHQSRNHELKLYWTVNKNKMIPEFNEKRFVTGYDFKYVHQLQNLYFALTGKEL
ncbi:MAG: hypothetical protein ACOVK2_07450 [Candidatus Fonsibacter sp.]